MTVTATAEPRSPAALEREQILRLLHRRRPDLARRTVAGPSGALLVPGPEGRIIEVGRLPRRGVPRWVVVQPDGGGVRVREAAGPGAVVALVLQAAGPARAP